MRTALVSRVDIPATVSALMIPKIIGPQELLAAVLALKRQVVCMERPVVAVESFYVRKALMAKTILKRLDSLFICGVPLRRG
jgi:hypothetical protein